MSSTPANSRALRRHVRDIAVVALVLGAACRSGATGEVAPAPDATVGDLPAPSGTDAGLHATGDLAALDQAGSDLAADRSPDLGGPDREPLPGFPPPGRQRLRGFWVEGNELRAFQSCGLPALTWIHLEGGEPGLEKLGTVIEPCGYVSGQIVPCKLEQFYVELDATVLPPCQCGHLGQYERALRVNELLSISRTAPSDCPRTMPFFP